MRRKQPPRAWAWEMKIGDKWEICWWAVPYKQTLLKDTKPSPEARPVCVRLVRNSQFDGEVNG